MQKEGAVHRLDSLVAQAQKGDTQAFAQVYEELFDRVLRYMLLRVGEQAEAEDLTQEVFTRVWENLPRYQQRGMPFAAWVFRIARNLVTDRYRRSATAEHLPLDAVFGLASTADPAEDALITLDAQRLHKALAQLTDLQRQVLLLRFGAGMSIQETAQVLQKSEGAIKALQHAGVENLRKLLTAKIPSGNAP
ncbi:MAG: sigma-70 family RNA polymerase sigma factor [Dehalococcoidia bacterium]|nr:sigma-70 family RNA polymerase sigma factor [Dehalococcoidia bacterium]MDW8119331.1 sigma-70 family RNA polymerase sigma factor [Chloroflexota bacterium]